jgi:hypothetical protein
VTEAGGGAWGIKLPFIHKTTNTTAAMIMTSDREIDHPMHTILDRFFLFRSSHVSLETMIPLVKLSNIAGKDT